MEKQTTSPLPEAVRQIILEMVPPCVDDRNESLTPMYISHQVTGLLGIRNLAQALYSAGVPSEMYSHREMASFTDGEKQYLFAAGVPRRAARITLMSLECVAMLAVASRSPAGADVRKWVCSQVIPALHFNSAYEIPPESDPSARMLAGEMPPSPSDVVIGAGGIRVAGLPTDERGRVNIGTQDFPLFVDPSPRSSTNKKNG